MVKKLATDGVGEMGKLIGYMPSVLRVLLFLFVISVILDFEYDIASIKSSGEVLGQASVLEGDTLVKRKEVQIPIKLLDVFSIILGAFIISHKGALINVKLLLRNKASLSAVGMIGLFLVVAAGTIFANASQYTQAQLLLMSLHLVKILQAMVVGVAFAAIVGVEKINNISKPFLLGVLISCITLILNKFGLIFIGAAAGDRMETFGVVIMAVLMAFHLYSIEASKGALEKSRQMLYLAAIFVASFATLTSGKRGVELVFLIAIAMLFLHGLVKKSASRKLLQALLAALLFSVPNLVADFLRTADNSYNALHGTIYREKIFDTYKEIISSQPGKEIASNTAGKEVAPSQLGKEVIPGSSPAGKEIVLSHAEMTLNESTKIPFISALDYSGAERIGKMLETLSLSHENGWIGTGFWGVQYKYGFLPDSGLQVLLETGLAGSIALVLMLYFVVKMASLSRPNINMSANAGILLAVLVLAVLSVFCNPMYMSRFVLMFVFFSFVCGLWVNGRENPA